MGGALVKKLEDELSAYLQTGHVVTCNSCTDALFLILRGLGIGPGDEVIVPSLTAAGTAASVVKTGAFPKFCDVDLKTRNINAEAVKASLTPRVKCIIVVHLHGLPVDLDPILTLSQECSIPVIEDCAQAIGATYKGAPVGSLGAAGAFSFYPTKNLGCMGDGGAVATDDAELAAKIRRISTYGLDETKTCVEEGINSRLDAIHAAVLSALLPFLDDGNGERVAAAGCYDAALKESRILPPPRLEGGIYHQYAVETDAGEDIAGFLAERGIQTAVHYGRGLHEEPYFRQFVTRNDLFPNTQHLTRRLCSLPIQPELMHNQARVMDALESFLSR